MLFFCMQKGMKIFYKSILWFWLGWSGIPKVPKIASLHYLYNISNKKLILMKLIFCMQIDIKVDYNTLGIKISCKVILSLLMDMIKHSLSSQSNTFEISLQNLRKEVRDKVHFLHADKHETFCKMAFSFLMEVARHVKSTQNRKVVIFLQYNQKKFRNPFVLYCDAKYSDILRVSSHVCCYFLF